MSTKVHSYLGGLNQDVTNKFEMTSNATVTVGNGTTTGNIHAGGNIAIGNIIFFIVKFFNSNTSVCLYRGVILFIK